MHQRTDAVGVLDSSKAVLQHASNKNITGKNRFDFPSYTAAGSALDAQARTEHLQFRILAQVRGRDVFVLGLCTGAKPGKLSGIRFYSFLKQALGNRQRTAFSHAYNSNFLACAVHVYVFLILLEKPLRQYANSP